MRIRKMKDHATKHYSSERSCRTRTPRTTIKSSGLSSTTINQDLKSALGPAVFTPRNLGVLRIMLCALSFAGAALVPGSSRPAVSTRSVTFGRRDMAVVAAAAFAGVATPAFAAAKEKEKKGPPANLGGPMAATQKTALGIVSDSEMPQFRGSKGVPIPPFKVAPLGKLDPKVRRALPPGTATPCRS